MKFMKSFPGGTLLVPMFLAAFIHTIFPNLFRIGGTTEALFSGDGLNFVLGATIFMSGCTLNLSSIQHIIQRYGLLLEVRTLICLILGYLYFTSFELQGIWKINLVAFVCTITSINPTLFLAIMEDCGDAIDKSTFGFVAIFATPVIALLVFSVTQPTKIDLMPMVSILIPLVVGTLLNTLDPKLGKFIASGMPFMIFALGWSVGTKIHLIDAVLARGSGIIMTLLYYLLTFIPLCLIEIKLMKRQGISSCGLSTIAGLSTSIPFLMASTNSNLTQYASQASSIITFGVIITAIVSPYLAKNLQGNQAID